MVQVLPLSQMLASHPSLPDRDFLLDEGPSTQPCEERTACGLSQPNTSSDLERSDPSYRSMLHNSLSKFLFYPDWANLILSWQACHTNLHKLALVASCRSHQIQGTDVCLQNNHWLCTPIPKLTTSDLCALQKLAFCK